MLSNFRSAQSYQHNTIILDSAKFLVAVGLLTFLIVKASGNLSYNWQWYRVPGYLFTFIDGKFIAGPLLAGLKVTLQIATISLLLSSLFGLATALFRLSDSFIARILARIYLETIRNTPLLVQLFFIYFVLSPVLEISRFACAVLALSLFEGAYASEIFRAGIVSIHRGQWEAARSLGLNNFHTYRQVILPQAIRRMLPPLASQAISLVKDSALVSTIAIYDLTMKGQEIIAVTYLVFEIWFTIAAIYLIITAILSVGVHMLEKHFPIEI
ncbi:MAG: amino acid ABC transporter permease [Desulfobacterales bacterium]|nr:amino acid ABC transporter permease [Desulfobacterales bacterium]